MAEMEKMEREPILPEKQLINVEQSSQIDDKYHQQAKEVAMLQADINTSSGNRD